MKGVLAILLLVAVAASALPSSKEIRILRRPSNDLQNAYQIVVWPPKTYDEAHLDCIRSQGQFAELETKEEEDYILKWVNGLEGTGLENIWLAGKWNGNNSYVWESGLPLRNDFHWRAGEPSQRNEDGRVALLTNERGIGFLTRPHTEENSYLCEFVV